MRHPWSRAAILTAALLVSPVAARAQSLNGLYLQNQSLGRGDVWHYYYFWPDGRMCNVMPKGGLDPAPAYAAVAAQAAGECGTFALRGNQLQLQTAGAGRPATLKLDHVDRSGFALSDFPTIHAPAFPNGATLEGTWKMLVIKGDDYRNQSYTFHANNTYSFDDVPIRATGAPARHVQGSYRLGGNTLQLAGGGGAQTLSIHPFPNDSRISIDGAVLQKQ